MKRYWLLLLLVLCLLLAGCGGDIDSGAGQVCQVHASDTDNNGYCDDCGAYVIVILDFYAVNDLHGKVCDSDEQPGVDELTTYLKNARKTDDNVILLSSGDMWQGSSESNLTKGLLVTEWMNELGFVSMTLGNHEYDWGEEYIEANAAVAEFPLLAINIYDRDTNQLVDYCVPSVTVEIGGATVGIIGAMGDCYSSIAGDKVEDVYFKTGSELTALVKAESERLRAAGADLIVYSLHDGKSYGGSSSDSQIRSFYDVALSDGYVDIVFEGHSHQSYTFVDSKGVYHLQGGGDNKGISHAEISVNVANNRLKMRSAEFVSTSKYQSLADDPIVGVLLDKYGDEVAIGNQVLGNNTQNRSGDALRTLVARLYLEAGMECWGKQYDIVLGGGYLSVRSPGHLARGEVKYSDLQMLFPFDNELVLCSISGSDLRSRFINTNNSNYFMAYSDYGNGVRNAIDPTATYYVVVDSYSASYAPNRLTVVESYAPDVFARDLLAEYVAQGGLAQ